MGGFIIQTDHKPLEGLFNKKKGVPQQAAPRVQRWALTLAAYEYRIVHKSGKTNGNAEAPSRLPLSITPESVPVPGETVLLLDHLNHIPISSRHIREWTRRDPVLSKCISLHSMGGHTIALMCSYTHILAGKQN